MRSILIFFSLFSIGCSAEEFLRSGVGATKSPTFESFAVYETGYRRVGNSQSPLIVLDAGHGGTDEGTKVSHLLEKRITLATTLLAKKHLENLGYQVVLTRHKDVYVALSRRVSIANKIKGALFVSIHFNAAPSTQARGIEVFYYDSKELWRTRASKRLAHCILHRLIGKTEAPSRGVKQGNYHVIRETQMPAVLIEGGFLTNREERLKLRDRGYLDHLAEGIAQGIDRYMKM